MTSKYIEDQKLAESITQGNKKALVSFWNRYQTRVEKFILNKVNNPKDAEEILQDTLLATLDSLRDYQGEASLLTYICAIAKNKIIDSYRKKKIYQIIFSQAPGLENLIIEATTPEEKFIRKELKEKIWSTFKKLTPIEAKILYLKYEQGLKIGEIAELFKLSIKAVESRLFRARLAFAKVFNEEEKDIREFTLKTKRNQFTADS